MGYQFMVHLSGGYQSHSIILTDSQGTTIPYGGVPGGPWDTVLEPGIDYGLSAILNCSLSANNLGRVTAVVRFWWFEGGVGTFGHLISEVPISIDFFHGGSFPFLVPCPLPFRSAPNAGEHRCAAVSISNVRIAWVYDNSDVSINSGDFCADPGTNPLLVPDPGNSQVESCSAWRNTDSSFVVRGLRWKFKIGLNSGNDNIRKRFALLEIKTRYIPSSTDINFNNVSAATKDFDIFEKTDLKVDITGGKRLKTTKTEAKFEIAYENNLFCNYEISGDLPGFAKESDVALISITAHYQPGSNSTQRSINFLQFLHVVDKNPFQKF